ncbi:hypothetical protein CFI10_12480 [Marinobacterium iners]|uniref:site-specific integrase n=1 Tax=Marinobacterium iners TaxID=48076 RepID=UPI001A908CDC|nr:site-specific integrase [Marinobacterium iners]QSR35804.1 hypothetical protein CFI10_12480 [Marinobacterium iners]
MPAQIPHTFRKSSGIYYIRYVLPLAVREQFPGLGRDIRFSLKTRNHADAKLKTYQNLNLIHKVIDIFLRYGYYAGLGFDVSLKDVLEGRLDDQNISENSGERKCSAQPLVKKDFYMIMEQITHFHPDGGITLFNSERIEDSIEALAMLRVREKHYSRVHGLSTVDCPTLTSRQPFTPPQPVYGNDFMHAGCIDGYCEPVPDMPDEAWDHIIARQTESPDATEPLADAAQSDITDPDEAEVNNQGAAPDLDDHFEGQSKDSISELKAVPLQGEEIAHQNNKISSNRADTLHKDMAFQDLVDDYFAQAVRDKRFECGSATYDKYTGYLQSVVEIAGADTPVSAMTPLRVQDIKNTLLCYPLNRRTGYRKHRSLDDLIADPKVPKLKPDTASECFDRLRDVLNHACLLEILPSNPAALMKIYKKKGRTGTQVEAERESTRLPYSDEELISLLNGYVYQCNYQGTKRNLTDAHYWAPLIAMYTGMRINEICQLHITDIKLDGVRWHGRVFNHPYIKVCADHPTQELKNKNAFRDIPIHDTLIEIGFLDYVKRRLSESDDPVNEKLFEGLKPDGRSKWARDLGRWFNGEPKKKKLPDGTYVEDMVVGYKHLCLGMENCQGKVFHSYRHTFTDMLRNVLDVRTKSEPLSASILGHDHDTSTAHYGEGYQIGIKAGAINQIRYSDEVERLVRAASFDDFEVMKWRIARADSYLHGGGHKQRYEAWRAKVA